jgi:hypothetical protein
MLLNPELLRETRMRFEQRSQPRQELLERIKTLGVLRANDPELVEKRLRRLEANQPSVAQSPMGPSVSSDLSTQVPISTIESRAGISFDGLAECDPLSEEAVGEPTGPLLFPEQIRFI